MNSLLLISAGHGSGGLVQRVMHGNHLSLRRMASYVLAYDKPVLTNGTLPPKVALRRTMIKIQS